MVILVVLTEREFRFSLLISQLLAKAIPVRGAILEKPAQGNLSGLFAVVIITLIPHLPEKRRRRTQACLTAPAR
ncbi:hypothetical protein CI789_05415 [Erwinia persicina]|nr:hypothetical protein CI789_05415 [Erwinia persicina]